MPVPPEKFESAFGVPWAKALAQGNVYNALDACKVLGVEADGLDALWAKAKKSKFGGGFCACTDALRGNRKAATEIPSSPQTAASLRCRASSPYTSSMDFSWPCGALWCIHLASCQ